MGGSGASEFTITALPETDVWRKPPSTDVFTAATEPLSEKVPLDRFQSVRVSFSGPWTTRYDQGGLLLHFTKPGVTQHRWIKAGVEFYQSQPYLASVACYQWADWSLSPNLDKSPSKEVTIELRREGDELGTSLWLYQILADGTRAPLREITWVFAEKDWMVEVSAMACRPAKEEDVIGPKELNVSFSSVHVQLSE